AKHIHIVTERKMEQGRWLAHVFLVSCLILGPVAHAAPLAYIACHNPDAVWVIDLENNIVVATVPIFGTSPNGSHTALAVNPRGIVVDPHGAHAYVANSLSLDISVIDTTSYAVELIPVGADTNDIAINPSGTRIYVTTGLTSVKVIDTISKAVIATVPGFAW